MFRQSQAIGVCAANLDAIGKALNQYSAEHGGSYPAKLDDLYPKYIADRSKLQCPESSSGAVAFPYEYKQPSLTAPDTTVVVTCRQHVVVAGQPPISVMLMKNGKVDTDSTAVQSPNRRPTAQPTPMPAPTKP